MSKPDPFAMFDLPGSLPSSPLAEQFRHPLHLSVLVGWVFFVVGCALWFPFGFAGCFCVLLALGLGFFGLLLDRFGAGWLFASVACVVVFWLCWAEHSASKAFQDGRREAEKAFGSLPFL